ncbi:glutamate ligase domain-containing protein, partial [Bacteroidota bacterium]
SFAGDKSEITGEILPSEHFLTLNLKFGDVINKVHTQLIGSYNFENVLAAVCIGKYFDIDPELIIKAIEEYTPRNNRSQFINTGKNNLFLDAYNANPTSVELSVKNFASLDKSNTSVILGDMLELGTESINEHEKIVKLLQDFKFDKIILVGGIFKSLKVPEDYVQFENVNELMKWLLKNEIGNSNVLIKGSRGVQLETIVEYL